jgi:hypothetical protein
MKHQHLVHELNARAQRLEELERKAMPAIYALLFAAVLVIVGGIADEYADSKHADSIKTANTFVECLNGKPIQTGDTITRCEVVGYEVAK